MKVNEPETTTICIVIYSSSTLITKVITNIHNCKTQCGLYRFTSNVDTTVTTTDLNKGTIQT